MPGIGSITGERARSQASAICVGVASYLLAIRSRRPRTQASDPDASGNHGQKAETVSLACFQHVLRSSVDEAVAILHRHDRDDATSALELVDAHVREPDVPDLALAAEVCERAD